MDNLVIMRNMDGYRLNHPDEGANGLQDLLESLCSVIDRKQVRLLFSILGLMAIYSFRTPTKLGLSKYICP